MRSTNNASIRLIEQGCPGKPLQIKFNTSEQTSIVMANNKADIGIAHAQGCYVLEADGVARLPVKFANVQQVMRELDLKAAFWQLEKGQVIHPTLRKPVVGDFDIQGVFSLESPGQNTALISHSKGISVRDITSPIVK